MLTESSNLSGRLEFSLQRLVWLSKVVPLLSGFSAHDSSRIKNTYLYGGQAIRGFDIADDNRWGSIRVDPLLKF